ncbi:MAG: AMP-binding protein [Clostridia bacterium]|nr:AMP-binding protein [Clostridia bacterium]
MKMCEDGRKDFCTLREMLCAGGETYGTCVAFHEKKQGFYQHISYGRFCEEVQALGTALCRMLPGAPRVLLVGKNNYHWALSCLALLCGAGVPVPADTALCAADIAAFAVNARVDAVLYDADSLELVKGLSGVTLICFDAIPQLIEQGKAALLAGQADVFAAPIDPDAPAIIFYKRGAVGEAKGVILSHKSIVETLLGLCVVGTVREQDIFLSVLPLSHVYECVLGLLYPIACGASVAFAEGLGSMMGNMREIHPTCMVAVPFLAERIYDKLWQLVGENEAQVRRAIAISDPVRPFSARQALKERLLAGARAPFGGALRYMMIVGGCLPAALSKGLRQLGIFAAQCYGMAECAGIAAMTAPTCYRDGTAGAPLPHATVELLQQQADGSGEIRIGGKGLMLGYADAAALTGDLQQEGYDTGDMGRIDSDGFLHIIGKKENCIIRADGTVISPEEIEHLLLQSPLVREAVVVGVRDEEPGDCEPAAMILPDIENAAELFGADYTRETLESAVGEWICEINKGLRDAAQILLFALSDTAFPRDAAGRVVRAAVAEELQAAKGFGEKTFSQEE